MLIFDDDFTDFEYLSRSDLGAGMVGDLRYICRSVVGKLKMTVLGAQEELVGPPQHWTSSIWV